MWRADINHASNLPGVNSCCRDSNTWPDHIVSIFHLPSLGQTALSIRRWWTTFHELWPVRDGDHGQLGVTFEGNPFLFQSSKQFNVWKNFSNKTEDLLRSTQACRAVAKRYVATFNERYVTLPHDGAVIVFRNIHGNIWLCFLFWSFGPVNISHHAGEVKFATIRWNGKE